MPEFFRKMLVPFGVHEAPQGTVEVTPDRARRWVDKFRKLQQCGIRFPVPWGHRLSAIPEEGTVDEDEYQAALENRAAEEARFNASYIRALDATPQGVVMEAMVPPGWKVCPETGDLINERDGTRIGEVSAGIGDWRDGKGRLHRDIVIHAALVPLPVWAGQDGFTLAQPPTVKTLSTGAVRLSFMLGSRSQQMAATKTSKPVDDEEIDAADKTLPEEEGSGPEDDYEDLDAAVPNPAPEESEPEELEEPEPVPTPAPAAPIVAAHPTRDHYEDCVKLLAEAGLPLPPDVDEDNFCSYLRVALMTALGMGAKFDHEEAEEGSPDQSPATATSSPPDQAPQPESPPMMMSTRSITDPVARTLARDCEKRMRNELRQTWEASKGLGCAVDIADREAGRATMVTLSLNPKTGKPVLPSALKTARLVLEILQRQNGVEVKRTLSTARPATSPTTNPNRTPPATKRMTDDGSDHVAELTKRILGDKAVAAQV